MQKLLLILPIVLVGCTESDLRIAVQTNCTYEKVAEYEYDVVRTYFLYNTNGTKDREWNLKGIIAAASHEYICFDDFAIEDGCSKSVMKKISGIHGGAEVYCIAKPE